MDRDEIEANLRALGSRLAARDLTGEILLLGGAYMTLVIRNREATKDIDAYFASDPSAIRTAAAEVARERGLPPDWLNDAVKGFIHRQPDRTDRWASYAGLNVYTPNAEYIFAMKAEAGRSGSSDFDDLVALRDHLGLTELAQALAIVEKYVPASRLSAKTKLTLETLFEEEGEGRP
jgi:hypothetical protein